MANELTLEQVTAALHKILPTGLVPMIHGSPGVGKSAIVYDIAGSYNLKIIDFRLGQADPTDLLGFPQIDPVTKRGTYAPMDTFPLEGDALPIKTPAVLDDKGNVVTPATRYNGWLLFLDEFNSASPAVQAAAYKLILDKMVGMHNLHKNVVMIAAGNLATDQGVVNRMPTPLQSRLAHLVVTKDNAIEWLRWAPSAGIDHRVSSFVAYRPEVLNNFDPKHTDLTYACQRTWESCSKIVKSEQDIDFQLLDLLSGIIGEGAAREFIGFCSIYANLPQIAEIQQNPLGVSIKDEPSVHYALSGMVQNYLDKSNAKALMQFVMRLGIEFQILALRGAVRRDRDLRSIPEITQWLTANMDKL